MIQAKQKINTSNGVYVELKVSKKSSNDIRKYCEQNEIQYNDEFHITVIYSRKSFKGLINIKGKDVIKSRTVDIVRFDNQKENIYALALKLKCPLCEKLHNLLMNQYNFKYDYPEYIPHITLSYKAKDINPKSLPLPKFDIILDRINIEELNENWADNKK